METFPATYVRTTSEGQVFTRQPQRASATAAAAISAARSVPEVEFVVAHPPGPGPFPKYNKGAIILIQKIGPGTGPHDYRIDPTYHVPYEEEDIGERWMRLASTNPAPLAPPAPPSFPPLRSVQAEASAEEPRREVAVRAEEPRREFAVRAESFDKFLRARGIRLIENLLRHPEALIDEMPSKHDTQARNAEGRRTLAAHPGTHNLVDVLDHYCREVGMGPQLDFMDGLLRDVANPARGVLREYVRSALSISGHLDAGVEGASEEAQVAVSSMESIFSLIPPLTEQITVFRKWGKTFAELDRVLHSATATNMVSARYLSTSLALAISNEHSFHGDDGTEQYARIDIMPGVRVLPLLNWEEWSDHAAGSLSQGEILLPRNARLHKIVDSTLPEFTWGRIVAGTRVDPPMAVGIISAAHPDGRALQMPRIQHHFIVSPDGLGEFTIRLPDGSVKQDRTGGKKRMDLVDKFKKFLKKYTRNVKRTKRTYKRNGKRGKLTKYV